MEIIEKPPLYLKEHGEIKTYQQYKSIFPKGVTICNGRSYDSDKLGWQKFRNHTRKRGKRCTCPIFSEEDNKETNILQKISILEIKNKLLIREVKIKDENKILVERENIKLKEKLKILKDYILKKKDKFLRSSTVRKELENIEKLF